MNKLQIEGLTEEQCNMLDAMWDKETAEDLFDFFKVYHKNSSIWQ